MDLSLSACYKFPVILVPGLVGWGYLDNYWDSATDEKTNTYGLTVLQSHPSVASSQHDRACDIFAEILGRVVDYGEEHAKEFSHCRFGEDFSGHSLHPNWCEKNPVHIISHSSGANACRYLQYLLSIDYWKIGTTASWIRSISFIAPNLCGSLVPTMFGIESDDDIMDKSKLIDVMDQLLTAVKWASGKMRFSEEQIKLNLTWKLEQWDRRLHDCWDDNWLDAVKECALFANIDNAFYDLYPKGCSRLNKLVKDNPTTYYFSYYCKVTNKSNPNDSIPYSVCPVLIMPAASIMNLDMAESVPSDILSSGDLSDNVDWLDNDGVLSIASQRYPLGRQSCAQIDPSIKHRLDSKQLSHESSNDSQLTPGIWYYADIQAVTQTSLPWDHLDPVWSRKFLRPMDVTKSIEEQRCLYEFIFHRLSILPYV